MEIETVEAWAAKIAVRTMQADRLYCYDNADRYRRACVIEEICERYIHLWLLTKAKMELTEEGKVKYGR